MTRSAPKPDNWEALVTAWNDPISFNRELAIYNAQIAAQRTQPADITEPRWQRTPVACTAGHRWRTEEHTQQRTCLRCTASWRRGEPELRPPIG